jgi:hypothetical protein
MALRRLTLSVSVFLMAPALALATGGGYDEPPQPLSYYLKRLPAKSISEVLEESRPLPKLGTGSVINATELNAAFAHGPSPELVKEIDALLQKARANYTGPVDDNMLQDLRDLAGGKGAPAEVAGYAHWRLANPDLTIFKGTPHRNWSRSWPPHPPRSSRTGSTSSARSSTRTGTTRPARPILIAC